ncbi:MAG: ferric reductase-like transmembrane domain-containing protein [Mastigocoleus sp.]
MTIDIAKESITGYIGLIAYIATLLPNNFLLFLSGWKQSYLRRWLLKNRRKAGIICFFFSICHGFLIVYEHNINLFSIDTLTKYFTGLGSIVILSIMMITSNKWSIRKFGRNWKSLHRLTYLALFLLILHLALVNQGEIAWYAWCALSILFLLAYFWLILFFTKLNR